MLFTLIYVWTYGNSVNKHSKTVSFRGTKSKIDPDEAILSVKQPLGKSYIPATIFLVPATQTIFKLQHRLSSK